MNMSNFLINGLYIKSQCHLDRFSQIVAHITSISGNKYLPTSSAQINLTYSPTVTLKIGVRSLKSNQVFMMPKCYTQSTHSYTQESLMPTGSAPKKMSPSPLEGVG